MDNFDTRLAQLQRRLTVARQRASAVWAVSAGVLAVLVVQLLARSASEGW